MKIFYLCPDFGLPSGGVKVLYRQVEILRAHNFEAYILHVRKGFNPTWFCSSAPVVYMNDDPPIWPGDTVVVPETGPDLMKKFRSTPLNKVVVALNPHYIFKALPPGETWRDYGVSTVITSSDIIGDFVRWSMGIEDITVISTAIETDLFYFVPAQKKLQIAYMTRKDTATPLIQKILMAKSPRFSQIEFVPVGDLSMADYAMVLRQSHVYLTTSPFEGTNLSVLEAMACGCICLGYHGIGGKEYIVGTGPQQNFVLAETMNYLQVARLLHTTMENLVAGNPVIDTIRQNARATAAQFSAAREQAAVVGFWRRYIAEVSPQPVPVSLA